MKKKIEEVRKQVKSVISGKDDVIESVLTAIFAGGHILLEDMPGVGKTTLALAVSRALGLDFGRVQFTPDVVPSDITGFTLYDKEKKAFVYREGAAMCNFFLADEINRTSSKTQSALLEVMQENKMTVDGRVYEVPSPFIVLATQNPAGTAGTQMLPEAQLDRFMIKLSMGYPDFDAQVEILRNRSKCDPISDVAAVMSPEEVLAARACVKDVFVDEKIYRYITSLAEATRDHELIKVGMSPRGAIALCAMAKASAFMAERDFVTPEDVKAVLCEVSRHRLIMKSKASLSKISADDVMKEIAGSVSAPKVL